MGVWLRGGGLLLLLCCALKAAAQTTAPVVLVSVEPLAKVVREVAGERFRVQVLAQPGQAAHSSAYTPAQARALRQADGVIWLGEEAEPGLAPLVRRHASRALAVADLPGVVWRDGGHDHGHSHGHDHDHGSLAHDPHLWLAPENMRQLSLALVRMGADLGVPVEPLQAGQRAFEQRLQHLVARWRQQAAHWPAAPALTQHDAWGYLFEALGLPQAIAVSARLDDSVSSRQFARVRQQVLARQVQCILAEPESRLAQLTRLCPECRVTRLDPQGRQQADLYTDFLQQVGVALSRCLGDGPAG